MSWQITKGILRQLAEEIDKSKDDGTQVQVESLDQIWMDNRGRLVLVDWSPSNGIITHLLDGKERLERESRPRLTQSDCAALCETARLAMCGTSLPFSDPPKSISAIVPLHIRELLQSLTKGRESDVDSKTTSQLLETLDKGSLKPAEATFENRAFGLGFTLIPGFLMLGIVASLSRLGNQFLLDKIADQMATAVAADWLLQSADDGEYAKVVIAIPEFPTRDEMQRWLQNRQTLLAKWEKEYQVRYASLGPFSETVADGVNLIKDPIEQLNHVKIEWQQNNLMATNWKKSGVQEQIDLKLLAKQVDADSDLPTVQLLRRSPNFLFLIMLAPFLIWIVVSGVSKGGISMWISGLRIVDSDGRPVRWYLNLMRAFLAGMPFLVLQFMIALIDLVYPEFLWISVILYQVLLWLFLVYAILTIAFPRQAPQDWFLGTYLVPK